MHDLPKHNQAPEHDVERKEYLRRRQAALTLEGEAHLARLAAMPLARAAAELAPLFCLAAPEDLAGELVSDLGMRQQAAEAIAREINRQRQAEGGMTACPYLRHNHADEAMAETSASDKAELTQRRRYKTKWWAVWGKTLGWAIDVRDGEEAKYRKSLRRQKLHFVEGFTSVEEAHTEVFRQLTMLAERRRTNGGAVGRRALRAW
jgi:hypothetical protein